jgi:hypothetical protein
MAMGLGSFGRGRTRYILLLSMLHVIGGALGGAIVGTTLGGIGILLSLSATASVGASVVILLVAFFALWQAETQRPARLGLKRQVPRSWGRTMAPVPRFLLWGMLLGSGVATLIPYSALLVLLAAQMTSGLLMSALSGMLFGATRAVVMLLPLVMARGWVATNQLPFLLPALTRKVQRFNIFCILVGSALLLLTR